MKGEVFFLPFFDGLGLKPSDIASLTETRQTILIELLHGTKTISQISKKNKMSIPKIMKAIVELKKDSFIEQKTKFETNDGEIEIPKIKFYQLTKKGKFLSLLIAKPNGWNQQDIDKKVEDFFKEDLKMDVKMGKNIFREAEKIKGYAENH